MKILIITPGKLPVPATKGGAVENLIEILIKKNEVSKAHKFTIVSIYDYEAEIKSRQYKYSEFKFIKIDDKNYKFKQAFKFLINRIPNIYIGNEFISRVKKTVDINSDEYDKIIIENAPHYGMVLKSEKLYLHMHNDFLNKSINKSKLILNRYKKVFALSNYIKKRIEEIDLDYKEVYTLYNGIEIEKFSNIKKSNELREKMGFKSDDYIYIYTGRIVKEKGVKELIKAFNLLKNKSKLLIVGSLKDGRKISKKYIDSIEKISKNSNIIFTDVVSYDEIPKYIAISNVGIVPSLWEEPFALTVIEHMASGNPVIVTESGGMVELVNEKVSIKVKKDKNIITNLFMAMNEMYDKSNKYNSKEIIQHSMKYNSNIYYENFKKLIEKE